MVLLGGCDAPEEPVSTALYELERMTFVPGAPLYLKPTGSFRPFVSSRWNLSVPEPLLFDRFELTRRDFAHYAELGDLPPRPGEEPGLDARDRRRLDWPAPVTFEEALALAELRGMRLPTCVEWLHVAIGRSISYFPWGQDQSSVANTDETGVGTPTAVGTFENGRSIQFGCYDLVGNVWEWVVGPPVPGHDDETLLGTEPDDERPMAMGGAYDSRRWPTYEWDRVYQLYRFHARRAAAEELHPSIGTRMCADAREYLWENADRWGTGEEVRERVVTVARGWCEDAIAEEALRELLNELTGRPDAPAALRWLAAGLGAAQE